jgi:RNA polymerase-binding transcription factor
MGEKMKYSDRELKEFEEIILEKLEKSKKELEFIKNSISRKNDEGADNSMNNINVMEDSAEATEKENLNQLAGRQIKFIQQLENALVRIKNQTYGICIETGKLISKERLKAVPHTRHSIEAKMNQN